MTVSRLETLVNMGFQRDPFFGKSFDTADSLRIRKIANMAVRSHAIVNVIGERGMGKTEAVNSALSRLNVRTVRVRSADKYRLTISDIEYAMILDLSEETPKRSKEVRARQLRRILGESTMKQEVVVVIEEGHRLHGNTLRALKTLRETDWMGKAQLFSVVLLGQSNPMHKGGVAEVRLRSDAVQMQGLTEKEIVGYLQETVGKAFQADAIRELAAVSPRNFLDLQDVCIRVMAYAFANGNRTVGSDDVRGFLAAGKDGYALPQQKKPASSGALKSVLGRHQENKENSKTG